MKHSERFNRAISKLVRAFFDGTLAKGDCSACAVGNICGHGYWSDIFVSIEYTNIFFLKSYRQRISEEIDDEIASRIKSGTGYTWYQLAKVESAFEKNTSINHADYPKHTQKKIMEDQFRGLMAVCEVLCEIEGIAAEETKELFKYTPDFKPVKEQVV